MTTFITACQWRNWPRNRNLIRMCLMSLRIWTFRSRVLSMVWIQKFLLWKSQLFLVSSNLSSLPVSLHRIIQSFTNYFTGESKNVRSMWGEQWTNPALEANISCFSFKHSFNQNRSKIWYAYQHFTNINLAFSFLLTRYLT